MALIPLSDTFPGTAVDTTKWTVAVGSGHMMTVAGGQLTMALVTAGGFVASDIKSVLTYDFTGLQVYVDIASIPNPAHTEAQCYFEIIDGAGTHVGWQDWTGLFQITSNISSWDGSWLSQLTFDPVATRYLSIRESGGIIYFEYSSDAVLWTPFYSHTTDTLTSTAAYVHLGAYTYASVDSPGSYVLNGVNVPGTTAGPGGPPARVFQMFPRSLRLSPTRRVVRFTPSRRLVRFTVEKR